MNGVTTVYAIPCCVAENMSYGQQVESNHPVSIPGIEGIMIPRGTNGYILKVLQEDSTLVRWEVEYLLCATKLSICLCTFTLLDYVSYVASTRPLYNFTI